MIRATQIQGGLFFLFVVFFWGLWTTAVSAQTISLTKTADFRRTGDMVSLTFDNLPPASSSVTVQVTLFGDYQSSRKLAQIYIDGSTRGLIRGGDRGCTTTPTLNRGTFTVPASDVSDGKLQVVVRNSSTVQVNCPVNRAQVTVSYTQTLPDFTVSLFQLTSTSTRPGGKLSLQYRIQNLGGQTATAAVKVFLSSDAQITNQDPSLNHSLNFSLGAGKTSPFLSVTLTVPTTTAPGTYYLGLFVDFDNKIKEGREDNNIRAQKVTVLGALPDLSFVSVTVNPTTLTTTGTFRVSSVLKNAGTQDLKKGFAIRYRYCTTRKASSCAGTLSLQSVSNSLMAGGKLSITSPDLRLPSGARTGSAAILVELDATSTVQESDETNNTSLKAVTVAEVGPDLVVATFSAESTVSNLGGTVRLRIAIKNKGSQPANGFSSLVVLSYNTTISTNDVSLLPLTTQGLKAGETSPTTTVTVTLPTNLKSWTVFVGLVVDEKNAVRELNETNNTSYVKLTIRPVTDLSLGRLNFGKQQVKAGESLKVEAVVFNGSFVKAPSATVGLYLSTTTTVTPASTLVKKWTIPSIPSRRSYNIRETLTLPATLKAGSFTLGVFVDPENKVAESSKANNSMFRTLLYLEDLDKDRFWSAPGCPAAVNECDCNDQDPTTHPKASERCDGKDNDCDGAVDEGCLCKSGDTRACGSNVGTCVAGTQTCRENAWGACVGGSGPTKESCDGKDNDCDGKVDEDGVCPEVVREPPPEPTSDAGGEPVTPDGDKPSNCAEVTCGEGFFCRKGGCVKACGCLRCPEGQRCIDGRCQVDLCTMVQCLEGEICTADGKCAGDPCLGITCKDGNECRMGRCEPPLCASIACPAGMWCQRGQCVGEQCSAASEKAPDSPRQDAGPPVSADRRGVDAVPKGEGCLCEQRNGGGPSFLLLTLLLGLLGGGLRRRARLR